jgi:hypothetical protein
MQYIDIYVYEVKVDNVYWRKVKLVLMLSVTIYASEYWIFQFPFPFFIYIYL